MARRINQIFRVGYKVVIALKRLGDGLGHSLVITDLGFALFFLFPSKHTCTPPHQTCLASLRPAEAHFHLYMAAPPSETHAWSDLHFAKAKPNFIAEDKTQNLRVSQFDW